MGTFTWTNWKTREVYETTALKVLDIRLWRTVILERWETNWGDPSDCPVYCLENTSRYDTGQESPGRGQQTSRVEEKELIVQRDQGSYIHRAEAKEEKAAQKESSRNLQRFHFKYLREYWSVHICKENQSLGKETPERKGETVTGAHKKPRLIPVSTSQNGKLYNSLGRIHRRVLPQ